jgi:epoxyqueuosine reductase QueG
VKAGIGKWGKNSLIIHEKFGPWLRFAAIEVNLVVSPHASDIEPENLHVPHPGCKDCQRCLEACPVSGLLKSFRLTRKEKCLAFIQLEIPPTISPIPSSLRRCDKCLTVCMPQSRER